ncbi:MAG: hypothetical protein GXP29_04125 [Planctomycetes bacterium]|nr:hypothetical protein [Planctomycetota bacterium]
MPFFDNRGKAIGWEQMLTKRSDRLTKFWLILDHEDRYGPNNIGVSAYSGHEALEIIDEHADLLRTMPILKTPPTRLWDLIVDIDLDLIDAENVLPYIGDVDSEGVWWPKSIPTE